MHYFLLLTFLELPQFVVTVEEDDKSEEVNEEEADNGDAGDSGPVFTDLVVHPPGTEAPPGPASLLLNHRGRQPLPHSAGDVLTKIGDGEDHGLAKLLQIAPPCAGADVRDVGLDAQSVCLAVAVLARLGQVNCLQNIRAAAGFVVVVYGGGGFHLLIGSL